MAADSPVSNLLARARAAQAEYERFDQAQVDDVVAAIAWTILEPERNRYLSERAVEDTGLGDVNDKFRKNYRKTLGLLRDLTGAPSVGVISEDSERGIIEIARPVGVVGAITPSTNPVATPTNKVSRQLPSCQGSRGSSSVDGGGGTVLRRALAPRYCAQAP